MIQYNIENNYGNIAEKVNNYYLEQENLEQIIEKIQVYLERFQEEVVPENIRYKIYDLAIDAISYRCCTDEQLQYLYAVLGEVCDNFEDRLKYYKKAFKEIRGNEFSKTIYREYIRTLLLHFLQNLGNIFRY
ncbi:MULTISPECIES: hypothetical protein [Fusobacterium]|uniref:Uncharacterized protein n=2 Tax=Fusobacterium TaxID=848 RepID=A0AAN3VU18_9FUSO|nr:MULTISPECIES: hypothetical protein [Fusobacterium]EJU15377.1 hypothetical protein HMPREF1127_1797 [Fusobacterium necrophorum subsp. funduliforme Fnf 1007]KXA17112.1 hypothetical protein HMPREF3206_00064 [Fusobacterium equinum]